MAHLIVQAGQLMSAIVLGEDGPLAAADSEQDLLVRARAGEAQAFDALLTLHEPRVRKLAHQLLAWRGSSAELDDVVQDVFVRLLVHLPTFRGEASLATWLTTVTLNRCRAIQRRRWVRLRWLRRQSNCVQTSNVENELSRDETTVQVRQAVQQLKQKDREVVVLFYLEQRPAVEIANILGCTANAVDVRLHRARVKLRGLLGGFIDET